MVHAPKSLLIDVEINPIKIEELKALVELSDDLSEAFEQLNLAFIRFSLKYVDVRKHLEHVLDDEPNLFTAHTTEKDPNA